MEKTVGPEWLGYEARRLGRAGLVTPALIVGFFALLAVAMVLLGTEKGRIADTLSSVPEVYLPLTAGLVAATTVAQERALDLQLTVTTRYKTTALRRLTLLLCYTASASVLWSLALRLFGLWSWPGPFLLSQLGWMAPLLWFVSAGTLLALVLRSRIASGAILGAVWMFQYVLGGLVFNYAWSRPFYLFPMDIHSPQIEAAFGRYWFANWSVLGATALAMVLCAVLLLGRNEYLVKGGDA